MLEYRCVISPVLSSHTVPRLSMIRAAERTGYLFPEAFQTPNNPME